MTWPAHARYLVARALADTACEAARKGTRPELSREPFATIQPWAHELEVRLRLERDTALDEVRQTFDRELLRLDRLDALPPKPPKLNRWSIVELRCPGWELPTRRASARAWPPSLRTAVASALSDAFRDCEWDAASLADAARKVVGRRRFLEEIVGVICRVYRACPADAPEELARVIRLLLDEQHALGRLGARPATLELRWLADLRAWERTVADERLRNYTYCWHQARGSGTPRLIESPKPLLRDVQRRLLHQVLAAIPCHDAAHGFRRGHSVATHARRHVGRDIVYRWDLEGFFASVSAGRVYGIYRTAGYPEQVARLLTGLCTNAVPRAVLDRMPAPVGGPPRGAHALRARLANRHLPQGAPTSPALANLSAFRLDCRLAGLASTFGGTYSRYADDLVISTDRRLDRNVAVLHRLVVQIVRDEGFQVNETKTRLMPRSSRQSTCGVVINERPNIPRDEIDRLRALLHDARRNGPEGANRARHRDFRAHVLGRIAWVAAINPDRAARLRASFETVAWPNSPREPR